MEVSQNLYLILAVTVKATKSFLQVDRMTNFQKITFATGLGPSKVYCTPVFIRKIKI